MKNHTLLARPRPARLAVVLLTLVVALGLTGCRTNQPKSAAPSAQKLSITIKGNTITPTNKRVTVAVNEPLTIEIKSDRSGELHLHSSPEQHIEFTKGTTAKKITLKVPGLVELEEHKSNTLIAQLEAR